jgi:hypothetical protein
VAVNGMSHQRGRKSGLPPRVPRAYRLPKLDEMNFAAASVLGALSRGAQCDAEDFDPHEVDGMIKQAVSFYIGACNNAVDPKTFRRDLDSFRKALATFVLQLPSDQSAIADAIKLEWMRRNTEDIECPICDIERDPELIFDAWLGFERLGAGLHELMNLARALADAESGAGKDANRPAHELADWLAKIYEELTGKEPTRDGANLDKNQSTPFYEFVAAVDALMAEEYRLGDIDSLVRLHLERRRMSG